MEKPKTPKELIAEKKAQAKVQKLRALAKLINQALAQTKVDEAENKLSILATEIDATFNQRKMETKVKDLKLKTQDSATKELIKLVEDLTIAEAVAMLYGFDNQIKAKINKEMGEITIEKLNIELL